MVNEAEEQIFRKCREFEDSFQVGSIKDMVRKFYHSDAILEGRDLPAQLGHDAITSVFQEARISCDKISINLDPILIVGDVAFGSIRNSNWLNTGEVETHRGLMVWLKKDEEWRVIRDFFFTEGYPIFDSIPLVLGFRDDLAESSTNVSSPNDSGRGKV